MAARPSASILLGRSLGRLAEAGRDDVPALVRAVRLAFLAVAAFAAAAGWALAHPLPLIVAAVIAGIDVVETSFLLLVVGARTHHEDGDQPSLGSETMGLGSDGPVVDSRAVRSVSPDRRWRGVVR